MSQRLHAISVRARVGFWGVAGICALATLVGGLVGPASAGPRGNEKPQVERGDAGKPNPLRAQYDILGKARRAFYEGKNEECLAVLEDLEGDLPLQVRLEGKFLAARALYATGNPKDAKQSQKLLEQLSREISDWKAGPVRLAIARALALEDEDKAPEAIRALEAAIARGVKSTATAEAQIELARLLAQAGRVEEAGRQLDSADGMLKRQTKVEMYKEEAAAYFAWIEKTRKSLKYDANPGLAEVEEADRLRAAGKSVEAGKIYDKVTRDYPGAESADRANVGLGWCILGRRVQVVSFAGSSSFSLVSARPEDVAAAVQHWKAFVTSRPAGRWRGQAYCALLSLAMDGRVGQEEAGKLCQLAATSLAGALGDEKSKPSWQACQFELRLKLGTLAWVHGRPPEAAEQLNECASLAGGERGEKLREVVDCIQAGKPLLPDDIAAPNSGTVKPKVPTDRAGLILSVAVIQALAGETDTAQQFVNYITSQSIPATAGQLAFAQFLGIEVGGQEAEGNRQEARDGGQKPTSLRDALDLRQARTNKQPLTTRAGTLHS